MKEAYAVRRTVPLSAGIQASIDKLLSEGMVDDSQEMLSELGRLGARLIIQRAVEDEFDQWLGRTRYERRAERERGLRNGFRPRHVQTAEGELRIEIPRVREAAMSFVSKLFSKWHCKRLLRTDPLKALVIGGFVRGLSMRDVESLCEEAGLGRTSKSTVATICAELHERLEAFCRRSLYDVNLVVLFLDAIYLPVRPSGPKEGVICAWGITETGARELVSVRLGMREAKEDWLELGRDLTTRGLAAPRLVVADAAPGLISAIEEIWPRADRQHCAVHRLRNLPAKLPKSEQDRVRSTTGPRSPTRPQSRTQSSASRSSSQSSSTAATSPPLAASQTTSTRSSCTCATRSDTANGSGQRISGNGRSVRFAGARHGGARREAASGSKPHRLVTPPPWKLTRLTVGLARVCEQAACLSRRRRRWCRRGAMPVVCLVRPRGIERVVQGVLVVSIDRLIPVLRSGATGLGQSANELGVTSSSAFSSSPLR
jgi:transposase-like protein